MDEFYLKKCPFCGSDHVAIFGLNLKTVYCKSCDAGTGHYVDVENAVKAWNRREGEKEDDGKGSL